MSPRMVPVFLEPTKERKVVVFGGGMVAYRKCRQFEGFRITVVADRTVPGMEDVCDEIVLEHFDPSDISPFLEGAFIAVAATDSSIASRSTRDKGCPRYKRNQATSLPATLIPPPSFSSGKTGY